MKKNSKFIILFVVAALVAGGVLYMNKSPKADKGVEVVQTKNTNEASSASLETTTSSIFETDPALNAYDIGSPNAPVTIIEYASFSCGHCANFHNHVFPEVKKKLVETGKVRFIVRDFPTNIHAFKASKLSHCVAQSRHKGMVGVLFKNQKRWLESEELDTTFIQIGRLAGIDDITYKKCQEDKEIEAALLKGVQEAQQSYEVNATPTFIFISKDGRIEKFSGVRDVVEFEKVVEKLSK